MSDREMLDKIFDSMLYEALKEVESEKNPDLPKEMNVEFSERHKAKIRRIFNRENKKILRENLYKSIKYIAAGFGTILIVSSITVMSVDALRTRVMNFIFNARSTDTAITSVTDGKNENYRIGNFSIEYIPDGFQLEKQREINQEIYLLFENSENALISITVSQSNGVHSVDTEDAYIEEITINGIKSLYSTKDGNNILAMCSEKGIVTIQSTISRDEIIKIARNIETK